MDGSERPILFLGDLDDPWVVSILGATADSSLVRVIPCRGDLPERPFEPGSPPRIVVLHRSRLSAVDTSRLERWRLDARPNSLLHIILCFSPYVRYAELERCLRATDLVLPEATAVETLPRHVMRMMGEIPESLGHAWPEVPPIEVVSNDYELQVILAEICSAAGFEVTTHRDLRDDRTRPTAPRSGPVMTLWDVPVLEPDWPQRLENRCKSGPVVVLLGFADRAIVVQAQCRGAAACLDVPFDLHDLIDVLNRLGRSMCSERSPGSPGRSEPGHPVPPAPASRASRGRVAILDREPRT